MNLLFCSDSDDIDAYQSAMSRYLPEARLVTPQAPGPPEAVRYALVWAPPPGVFARFPALRAVFNLGAGVDGLLAQDDLPAAVPVFRLEDAGMAPPMVEWVLYGVLRFHRDFDLYAQEQAAGRWTRRSVRPAGDITVALLGIGALGRAVARQLDGLGYRVRAWSRRPREMDGITVRHGPEGLHAVVTGADILVCLLPLTGQTRGLLNRALLSRLAPGAAVLNPARGAHLVDDDLLELLDSGHLRGAVLDAFDPEPLPPGHRFWSHPRVRLTPHVAAPTLVEPACAQIASTIHRLERGDAPGPTVDRDAGY